MGHAAAGQACITIVLSSWRVLRFASWMPASWEHDAYIQHAGLQPLPAHTQGQGLPQAAMKLPQGAPPFSNGVHEILFPLQNEFTLTPCTHYGVSHTSYYYGCISLYIEQTYSKLYIKMYACIVKCMLKIYSSSGPTEVPSGMTMAKNRRALADAPGTVKVLGMELGTPTAVLPPGVMFASCWLPAGLHTHSQLSLNRSTG